MKAHGAITITREWLAHLHPCLRGAQKFGPMLPAKISTDPVRNMDLACCIAEQNRDNCDYWSDVWWLLNQLPGQQDLDSLGSWPLSYCFDNEQQSPEWDAFVVAQWLAWIADAVLSQDGK